jgi:hypothetical protein
MADLTKITGGKVTFGLTVCPKQYESKRADVELTFTVGEGDSYDEVFDKASRAVVNRVRVLVDLPKLAEPVAKAPVSAAKTDAPKTESLFGD